MRLIYAVFYRWASRPTEEVLLNRALSYAMALGKHWMAPTQARMQRRFPFLSAAELDALNNTAREAMDFGHTLAYELAELSHGSVDPTQWRVSVLQRFPWVDNRNLRAFLGQGKYYAWKDGVANVPHA